MEAESIMQWANVAQSLGVSGLLLVFVIYGIKTHNALKEEYVKHLVEDIERLEERIKTLENK